MVYDHGLEVLDDVPVQLLKVYPEFAVAVSVMAVPAKYSPDAHPTEFEGEAVAEAPPEE